MQNLIVILTLLVVPWWLLGFAHVGEPLRARVGLALVFAFTGLGHFLKTAEMAQMLPPWTPARVPLVYLTGVFELLCAVCILIPHLSRYAGIALCAFLLLVLPSNVYAALNHVEFGGHSAGPAYLLVRVPLQLLLVGWVYWFAIRQTGPATGGLMSAPNFVPSLNP